MSHNRVRSECRNPYTGHDGSQVAYSEDAAVKRVKLQLQHGLSSYCYPNAVINYYNAEPVRQRGRRICGFAAAAMAASIIRRTPNLDRMVNWARLRGLTKHGDLFDVRNMQLICDRYIGVPSTVMCFPTNYDMIEYLIQGDCFLVPYDAMDSTGRPGKVDGFNAHWALVSGVVLLRPPSSSLAVLEQLSVDWPIYKGDLEYYAHHADHGKDLLLAQHGWTGQPDIWSFDELRASCSQLNRTDPRYSQVLPPGGIKEGLRNKVLRLEFSLGIFSHYYT